MKPHKFLVYYIIYHTFTKSQVKIRKKFEKSLIFNVFSTFLVLFLHFFTIFLAFNIPLYELV